MTPAAFHSRRIDRPHRRCRRGGFTLVEALLAAVVLAVAVLGACSTLSASYQNISSLRQTATAVSLARELIEEIAARPYVSPIDGSTTTGPTASMTNRSLFAKVGDYQGYTDSTSNMIGLDGSTVSVGQGEVYTRGVTITFGAKPSVDTSSPANDFALVTVTVAMPSGQKVSLSRMMANETLVR
jgi:type II secretory pathway pseudopilin PulG